MEIEIQLNKICGMQGNLQYELHILKEKKKSKINIISFHFRKLEEEEGINPKRNNKDQTINQCE